MDDMKFFSSNAYIYLPTKKNPKVALAVDNPSVVKNAFKLYNPFSSKAKVLKKIAKIYFQNFNATASFMLKSEKKSDFVIYLEKKLREQLIVSLYFATAKDKVVLQLQTRNANIIGYLKYPLNDNGIKHIENEIKALDILSANKIVSKYLFLDIYNDKPFLLIQALSGKIEIIEKNKIKIILDKFKKKESYILLEHPRIQELKKSLLDYGLDSYIKLINDICKFSKAKYSLVYEHGDFAPWNIMKIENSYIPFDFEYFVENGLEYLDIIKYYFQIGKLLCGLEDKELVKYVSSKIDAREIKELIQLFLIKEILIHKQENTSSEFEETILESMEK